MGNSTTHTGQTTPYTSYVRLGKIAAGSYPTAGATRNNNQELYRLKAFWLVDFFPDELIIQEKTISVIRHSFLMSNTETILVKDIGRVVYIDTPVFAGLQILGKNPAHDLHIKALNKKEALHAKEIIEGLMLEEKGAVDVPDWLHIDTRRRDLLAQAGREAGTPHG